MAEEKKRKLTEFEKLMEKAGAISGDAYHDLVIELPVLSFGVLPVDLATGMVDPVHGNGGLRARDIAEVCGKPGQSKTALAEAMIKTTQKRYPHKGAVVALFSEPPDIPRMRRVGIDTEKLIILGTAHKDADRKKLYAENALDNLLKFSEMPETKLVIIDSVATLFTKGEDEKELSESSPVAALAKVMNRFVVDFAKTTKIAPLLLVNHYRDKINTGASFVPPNLLIVETSGGRTKEYLAMIRILASATAAWEKEGSEAVRHSKTNTRKQEGLDVTYTMFRNKYANKDSYRVCKSTLDFETSQFNKEELILTTFADYFLRIDEDGNKTSLLDPPVIPNGNWYTIGTEKFQGASKAAEYLRSHPEIVDKLEPQIIRHGKEFFADNDEFDLVDKELG